MNLNFRMFSSCFVPLDLTRSTASKGKSPPYSNAQHSAMINAHAEIKASAQKSCYTTIATDSNQTVYLASDTLEVAPENEANEFGDLRITPHKGSTRTLQ